MTPGIGSRLVGCGAVTHHHEESGMLALVSGYLARRRDRRERVRRLRRLGDCPECRHPWLEHPGTGNELDGMCGECAYEFEHDQRRTAAPGCRLDCPA